MTKKQKRFSKITKDIEFRMISENDSCWIKVVPLKRISLPSRLHLIINDENYDFDIYDKDRKEDHEIYFEGLRCTPCFYLKSGEDRYKINCDNNGIKIIPITESHTLKGYLKKNCNCKSSQATCWAKAVSYTSRPDKPPFNEM